MLPQVFLFLFGCFIQFVSAGSLFGLLQPRGLIRTSNSRVYGRQDPAPMQTVPTQCKSDCDPVLAVLKQTGAQECSPADCCQKSFVTGYFNCLKCAGAAENITDFKPAQLVLDELMVSCDAKGLPVPKQTLPGIDPNRPLPPPLSFPLATQTQTLPGIDPNRPLPSPPPVPSGTLPPSATNQQTVTGLPTSVPPLTASVTAPPVTTSSSTSSAISTRFLSPQFSHLLICAVSFVVLAPLLE